MFYRAQEKKLGQTLLPGLFWGRMPFLQILFLFFWRYLDRKTSTLDPALRALVQVRVAQLNWCAFCIDINALNLLKRTNSLYKVEHLPDWKNNTTFSIQEKAVLNYVEQVTEIEIQISAELMQELKVHLSDDQIVELTALISFQNMSAKFNAALNIPSQGMCKIPSKSNS